MNPVLYIAVSVACFIFFVVWDLYEHEESSHETGESILGLFLFLSIFWVATLPIAIVYLIGNEIYLKIEQIRSTIHEKVMCSRCGMTMSSRKILKHKIKIHPEDS